MKPFVEKPDLETWTGPEEALTVVASWKSKLPEKQHLAIRTERYRYIKYFDGSEELYDHHNDPKEWNNLSSKKNYQKVKDKLRKQLLSKIKTSELLLLKAWSIISKDSGTAINVHIIGKRTIAIKT